MGGVCVEFRHHSPSEAQHSMSGEKKKKKTKDDTHEGPTLGGGWETRKITQTLALHSQLHTEMVMRMRALSIGISRGSGNLLIN